jgi:hypothetical protein
LQSQFFCGDKPLADKTNLGGATHHGKAQNAVRTFADWLTEDLNDVLPTGFEGFNPIPRRGTRVCCKRKYEHNANRCTKKGIIPKRFHSRMLIHG